MLSFLAVAAGVWLFRDIPDALERLRRLIGDLLGGAGILVTGFAVWTLVVVPVVFAAAGGG